MGQEGRSRDADNRRPQPHEGTEQCTRRGDESDQAADQSRPAVRMPPETRWPNAPVEPGQMGGINGGVHERTEYGGRRTHAAGAVQRHAEARQGVCKDSKARIRSP
jgi:hypothetical protein